MSKFNFTDYIMEKKIEFYLVISRQCCHLIFLLQLTK